jgi:hypothetical protein
VLVVAIVAVAGKKVRSHGCMISCAVREFACAVVEIAAMRCCLDRPGFVQNDCDMLLDNPVIVLKLVECGLDAPQAAELEHAHHLRKYCSYTR